MLLTLFLVQHHRPEERGVLPRAIRPRLQEAAPLGLLGAFLLEMALKRAVDWTTPR